MANVRSLSDLKNEGDNGNGGQQPGRQPAGLPNFGLGTGHGHGSHGKVKIITSKAQYDSELKNAGSKLVVVDFMATWCGPCTRMAPLVAEASEKYTNVIFLQVDTDQLRDVAANAGITAMPTFQFYKNGTRIDQLQGASPDRLIQLIEKHQTISYDNNSSAGHRLGSAPASGVNHPLVANPPAITTQSQKN